ncbi:hypothetical protein [Stenotrophomonas maltophilia]|nr:hypothetical protein [Stenotrophomonas maltophilia]
MNQKDFMQRFDALAFEAFSAAGVADAAHFIASDGTETPCTALVDESVQQFGDVDAGPVPVTFDRITLQLSEVTPRVGAVVRIEGSGRRLKLVQKLRGDASAEQWEVSNA